MEDNRQMMELSETSPRNLPQTSCSTTADSASTSNGLGSTASSSGPPDSNNCSHLITIENPNATNGIHEGAAPASNNSAGTSQGQSSNPNEDPEIHEGAAPASNNSVGTSQGQSSNPNEDPERARPIDYYRPLLQAASKGDWPTAKAFYDNDNDCVRARITIKEATALHIAVSHQHATFIKKWLKLMRDEDLKLETNYRYTALHFAAKVGNVRIAKQLVEKNDELPSIPNSEEDTPLIVAAYVGHPNMVSYLFSVTTLQEWTDTKRIELFHHTIYNDIYDIALKILNMYPNIANANTECWWEALETLAKKPFSIGSERELSFWKSLLKYSLFKGMGNKALMKTFAHQLVEKLLGKEGIPDNMSFPNSVHRNIALIFEAAKVGNVEFLVILVRSYPDLMSQLDENNISIFHTAILYRQESVFNLIYEIGDGIHSLASYVALNSKENMLHLARELAPPDRLNIVSGAALQMQRELLWFKEIEKIVSRSYVNVENLEGNTPKEKFRKQHKELQKDGENWMKDKADYCMIVATLIATVMFAAAFTIPGGSSQEGISVFLRKNWFMVFFISDAIALCSSSTSIAIFLSILTSRYREDDFLKSLPLKLLFGLATLFISMTGMMVAFIATFFLVYTRGRAWTAGVVITSASIPIISFGLLHCKIWVDTFRSTFESRFLFRPHQHRLF